MSRVPLIGSQVPGVQRYMIGSAEVTAVLDGYTDVDTRTIRRADPKKISETLRAHFLPENGTLRGSINAFIVNTGSELILIDAGGQNHFGPTVGRLMTNISHAGYRAEQFDRILLTHMHPDHIAGIVDRSGAKAFPNATLHVQEQEWAFWQSPEHQATAGKAMSQYVDIARAAAAAYSDATELFSFGSSVAHCLTAIDIAGHTPGHTGFMLEADGAQLFVMGDVVNAAVLQFAHPEWTVDFDVDPDAAVRSRKRNLDWAASERLMVAGMHFPFPGVGFVEKVKDGYRFVPSAWQHSFDEHKPS